MLTARGLALCIGAVVAWGLGRLLGVDELYVVGAACVALVLLAVLATRLSSTRIAVRRTAGALRARQGEEMPIEVQLRNDGHLPASLLLVEDRTPTGIAISGDQAAHGARFVVRGLRARQIATLRWSAVGRRRGRYRVGPLRIRLRDPFGLAERSRRYRGTDDLVVYPQIEALDSSAGRGIRQGAETSALRRAFHRGDEFYTMRTYVVGDDLRHVHWPSTAHRGILMVRQHELPWNAHAVVHLDTRAGVHRGSGSTGSFERAVSATASVLLHLRDHDYDLRLHITTGDAAQAAPVMAVDDALVRLAEVTPATGRSSPADIIGTLERAGNGLLVTVLRPPPAADALGDHPELHALLRAGRSYRARVALVIAHHDDERCAQLAHMLQMAGWHAAAVAHGEPLGDAWQRAMVGVAADEVTAGAP